MLDITKGWHFPKFDWDVKSDNPEKDLANAEMIYHAFKGAKQSMELYPDQLHTQFLRGVITDYWLFPRATKGINFYTVLCWSKPARDQFFTNKKRKNNGLLKEHIIENSKIVDTILNNMDSINNKHDMLTVLEELHKRPYMVCITKEENRALPMGSGWWRYQRCTKVDHEDFIPLCEDPRLYVINDEKLLKDLVAIGKIPQHKINKVNHQIENLKNKIKNKQEVRQNVIGAFLKTKQRILTHQSFLANRKKKIKHLEAGNPSKDTLEKQLRLAREDRRNIDKYIDVAKKQCKAILDIDKKISALNTILQTKETELELSEKTNEITEKHQEHIELKGAL